MNDSEAFSRLVTALRPWLGQLVFVGGWAHRLHRLHPLAHPPAYEPVRTRDADVAMSPADPVEGDIAAALVSAGFQEELSGGHRPPVSQYFLGEEAGFYVEFLAPLKGSRHGRDGELDATVSTAGVTAQKLRYVDLLMVDPIGIDVGEAVGFPLETSARLQVAHPVTFVGQKLLIERQRAGDKRSQDVLYVHDTLELFGSDLAALRTSWREAIRPAIPAKTAHRIEELAAERFSTVTDVIRKAARIPQDRNLTPEVLQARLEVGLQEVFVGG